MKAKLMGEGPTTTEKPRDMGNTAQHVRDDGALLVKQIIRRLERISKNEVNTEEEMERIAAECISDLNILYEALMEVGAKVAPHYELEDRVKPSKAMFMPSMA